MNQETLTPKTKAEWLPHLPNEVAAQAEGQLLCGYLLALEGWRRGLELRFYAQHAPLFDSIPVWYTHTPGKLFTLSDGEKQHRFFRSRGDQVGKQAVEQGADKILAKNILEAALVAVPAGAVYRAEEQLESMIAHASELSYPLVVKISNGSFGRGVETGITSTAELRNACTRVKSEYPAEDIIVEEHLSGPEYRLYIVDTETVAAIEREPANVTGDGTSSVSSLIEQKNRERKSNPRLASCPIVVDEEIKRKLAAQSLSLDSVVPAGEKLPLRDRSNISLGGDPVDRLEEISAQMKQTAIEALRAFPEFPHGAVDIIDSRERGPAVIEVNPTAQLGSLLFPFRGKGRDVPKAIIDYYFPETVDDPRGNQHYFSLSSALEPLKGGALSVKISPCERQEGLSGSHWLLPERVTELQHKEELQRIAAARGLKGFLRKKPEAHAHLYVSGSPLGLDEVIAFLKRINIEPVYISEGPAFVTPAFTIEETKKEKQQGVRVLKENTQKIKKRRKKQEKALQFLQLFAATPVRLRKWWKFGK